MVYNGSDGDTWTITRTGARLPSSYQEKIKVLTVFRQRVIASHEGLQSQVKQIFPKM